MKKIAKEILLIILVTLLFSIIFNKLYSKGIDIEKFNPSPNIKKEAKKEKIKTINLKEAKKFFDANAIFVDARPPEEFSKGRVKNSFNIPMGDEEKYYRDFSEFCPANSGIDIVVYCDGKDCHASLSVAKFLKKKGYKKVYVFTGGWEEWMEADYPIEWD